MPRRLAVLVLALVAATPAHGRQATEAPSLSRQDRRLFEWFNTLGYGPNLAKAPLVKITAPGLAGTNGQSEEPPELGFLLTVRDGELRILTLSLETRTFRTGPTSAQDLSPRIERVELEEIAREAAALTPEPSGDIQLNSGITLESAELFVLAKACMDAQLQALAHDLLVTVRIASRKPDDLQSDLAQDFASRDYWNILADYQHGATRSEVRNRLQRLVERFPLFEYAEVARHTARVLSSMIDEDRTHAGRAQQQSTLRGEARIRELIFSLREQTGFQMFSLGSIDFLRPSRRTSPALELAAAGYEAVPQLIEALEDTRLTRAVYYRNSPRYVVTIGECVRQILQEISGMSFFSDHSDEQLKTREIKAAATAWWHDIETKGERQVLIEGTLAGRRGQATQLVQKYPQIAVATLRRALAGPSDSSRPGLISAMAEIRTGEELPLLREMLGERDLATQLAAARALSSRGYATESIDRMIAAWDRSIAEPLDPIMIMVADIHIADFLVDSTEPRAIEALQTRWKERSIPARLEAIHALGRVSQEQAARAAAEAVLIAALDDLDRAEDQRVSDVAANILSRVWKAKYAFSGKAPEAVRDHSILTMKNTWRAEQGLAPLVPAYSEVPGIQEP